MASALPFQRPARLYMSVSWGRHSSKGLTGVSAATPAYTGNKEKEL